VFQINVALKLRIANEFLHLAREGDSDEEFAERLRACDSVSWHVATDFVADEELLRLEQLNAGSDEYRDLRNVIMRRPFDSATKTFKDKRLAALETPSSFGDYCRAVGAKDPIYWRKIYTRIGLEYTSASPRGNDPVFV
jgi:hypothetical protein